MRRIEKTVFISYRRSNVSWALAIFQNLTHHGYDVFFDYSGIASGDFERVILGNIDARAHFLVLLTPSALERCNESDDWLRREVEYAISSQRNGSYAVDAWKQALISASAESQPAWLTGALWQCLGATTPWRFTQHIFRKPWYGCARHFLTYRSMQ